MYAGRLVSGRGVAVRSFLVVAAFVLGGLGIALPAGAATFSYFLGIPAAQSATDAIADMYPARTASNYDFDSRLTDGAMSGSYFSYSSPDNMVFVYGTADTNVYVSQVDIWVSATDSSRDGMDFDIAFSSDGSSYTTVITGTHNPPSTGTGWNLARFEFDASETRGMAYIRITSRGLPNTPRIGEIDVFTVPANRTYTKSYTTDLTLNQSTTDDVNGVVPAVLGGTSYYVSGDGDDSLTDADSPTSPTASTYYNGNAAIVTCRWDLASIVVPGTFLDRVDIWLRTTDTARWPMRFGVVVSADGSTWRHVADTGYRASKDPSSHLMRLDFEPRAIRDFRYIGIVDYPGLSVDRHGWITEIDIFTDVPKGTLFTLK